MLENVFDYLKRKHPEGWKQGELVSAKVIGSVPTAKIKWEFKRQIAEFQELCKAIQAAREHAAEEKLYRCRSDKQRESLHDILGGMPLCDEKLAEITNYWGPMLPHEDAGLLFADPSVDFEKVLTGISVLMLGEGKPMPRVNRDLEKWAEDFTDKKPETYYFLPEIKIESPSSHCAEYRKYSHYCMVTFHSLSHDTMNFLIQAFSESDDIFCYEFEVSGLECANEKTLIFKIALPFAVMPVFIRNRMKREKAEKHLFETIQKITVGVMGFKLPADGPHVQNRPEAIEKQIAALNGDQLRGRDYRSERFSRKKVRETLVTVEKRKKAILTRKK